MKEDIHGTEPTLKVSKAKTLWRGDRGKNMGKNCGQGGGGNRRGGGHKKWAP